MRKDINWKQPDDDEGHSEIGQLLTYLCCAHIKRFSKYKGTVATPILGLYTKNLKVGGCTML